MIALSTVAFLVMGATPAVAACAFGCSGGVDAFFDRTQYLWPSQTVTWSTEAFLDKGAADPRTDRSSPIWSRPADRLEESLASEAAFNSEPSRPQPGATRITSRHQ